MKEHIALKAWGFGYLNESKNLKKKNLKRGKKKRRGKKKDKMKKKSDL